MIDDSKDEILSKLNAEEETQTPEEWIENELRPTNLQEYIGQEEIKKNLYYFIEAAKTREEHLDHVLLHGPPGLGKTSLAMILAKEMNANIKITSGPAIEKTGDLAALLTNLREGDFLFIDEIHQLKKPIEEILYSAMEDFALDIMIGKGTGARSLRLKLPKFTLIGATTKLSKISRPLRERFGNILKLEFYTEEELSKIISRSATILDSHTNEDAACLLARASRGTPRIANRLLKRVRDFAQVQASTTIEKHHAENCLKILGVNQLGLDRFDIQLLQCIHEKFQGGPVGLSTLSAALNEESETVEDIHEPYLMQLGFLQRTPKGRIITDHAILHLNERL